MKYKFIFLISYCLLPTVCCFSQNWQWAKQIGGPYYDGGGTLLDANNNMYYSGEFSGSCYFDNDTLYSLGVNDMFLAKYDANGNELWTKRIGGNNPLNYDEWSIGLVIDNNNSCLYYSGKFYGSLSIDTFTVNSSGPFDMFIAKFDLSGNCLWLKKAGSSADDRSASLCLDASGNIYWAGVLGNAGTFDTNSLNKGTFLSRIDPSGNVIFVKNEMTGGYPATMKVTNNSLYFCGVTTKDTTVIDTVTLISNNYVDGLLSKLDLNGNVIWAKRFGGYSTDYASNFEMDTANNFYLTGQFNDSITIDGTTLSNNGKPDMFFGKFNPNGNLVWIKQSNSSGNIGANGNMITKDNEGKFYIVGYFTGNANFGNYYVNSPSQDMFIAKYDDTGNCMGIIHFSQAGANAIQIDSNGSLIVSGGFINSVNIGSASLTSHGNYDMFFAKHDAITGIQPPNRKANSSNQLLIFANPNTGKCSITVPEEFLKEENLTLRIYDNNGKLIQQQNVVMEEEKVKINLEAEAKGIYNVTLGNKKKSYSGKIMFE